MKENSFLIRLVARYEGSVPTRALVQLVPFGIGSAVDTLVLETLESIREDRARIFFDRLAAGDAELTDDVIRSEDFLHSYFSTYHAAMRSRRREKTALLADLLVGAVRENAIAGSDEYEELVSILDLLSYREIAALAILSMHEGSNPRVDGDLTNEWVEKHRGAAESEMCHKLAIETDEIRPFVQRLARSGFVQELEPRPVYGGSISHTGWTHYRLTSRYRRLAAILQSGREATESD